MLLDKAKDWFWLLNGKISAFSIQRPASSVQFPPFVELLFSSGASGDTFLHSLLPIILSTCDHLGKQSVE